MIIQLAKALQIMSGAGVIAVLALAVSPSHATAQQVFIKTKDGFTQGNVNDKNVKNRQVVRAQRYIPTIWIDPDGCEHWVFDDGFEGYMTPHVRRDGRPVCHGDKN